jgi:hypothetical protein
LENGDSEPSICKLFSLSVIYRADLSDLLLLYNIDENEAEKFEPVADPQLNRMVTSLNPSQPGEHRPGHIVYGHLGLGEFTMYPMIRPGAHLKIDTSQNKLVTNAWRNEHERPIYFVELRGGYTCGWCELQGNQLLIIPHHSSPSTVRQFTYPREAEIVGRVVSYSTSCVDVSCK